MPLIKKYAPWLFVLLLLAHCLFIYLGLNEMRTVSKILLVPVLLIWLAAHRQKSTQPSMLVYIGLVSSFLGDVLLSRSGETFFLFGMLAFIGTHMCNTLFFLQLTKKDRRIGKQMIIAISLLVLFSAIVFTEIRPNLGNFKIPILVYMFIISLMTVLATATIQNPLLKKIAISCFIPGAMLFVLSDATLAMNKFLLHEPMMDLVIMITYGAAQYLLVKGFVKVIPLQNKTLA
jgi:uncharacterized membrane protein YhhN